MARSRKSSRQSRRKPQRGPARPQPQRPIGAVPEVDPADVMEATPAPVTRAAAPSAPRPAPAPPRGARANPRLTVAGPSRLSERAIEEYHYVARDLRNIGMLVVVMAVLLVVAFLAFTALGVGRTA